MVLSSSLFVKRYRVFLAIFSCLIFWALLGFGNASAFSNDRLIDDGVFLNSQSMSSASIQSFLQQKGSALAGMSVVEAESHYPNYNKTVSVAQAIYDAGQVYGINPQVILATLQKEQSLITDPSPDSSQLRSAMGYGCPDNGACNDAYAGLFYQIDNGTWQFRLNRERAIGNQSWWNSAINYACNTPKPYKYYYDTNGLYPGKYVTFRDDANSKTQPGNVYTGFTMATSATTSLYCYTPHAYNNPQGLYGNPRFGTTGMYYSGSYNFVVSFTKWFGSPTQSLAFKSTSSPTVYMNVYGYKVTVPAMGLLQDYGVSPDSIQVLSQSIIDSMPTPSVETNGLSPTLSHLVTSNSTTDGDGNAIYVVSAGRKHHITSVEQMNDFGFSFNNVATMPLSYIQSVPGKTDLVNFIGTPASVAFKVSGASKRIIFDYQTFISNNPSGNATLFSYYTSGLIPSGKPVASRDILLKRSGSDTVYLLVNNNYHTVSTYDAYMCWGFNSSLKTPLYTLRDNTHIAAITPSSSLGSCLLNNGSGTTTLLSRSTRYTVPSSLGIASTAAHSDVVTLANKLPSGGQLKEYVNNPKSHAVWHISGGSKKPVPTYSNFVLLGINSSNLSAVDDSAVSSIPNAVGVKLATGQVIKSSDSPSVYVVSGNSRVLYSTSDNFLAYGNSWGDIETYPRSTIDTDYPYNNKTVNRYLYDQPSDSLYIVDLSGCYKLSSTQHDNYGQNQSTIASTQGYTSSALPKLKLPLCKSASVYVKDPNKATVYWLDSGTKRPVSDWNKLTEHSGSTSPYIINLNSSTLQTFTTGQSL